MNLVKIFILLGVSFILLAIVLFFLQKFNIPVGRLPGDIFIKKENFSFYFPITTCILGSLILTAVAWLLRR